MEQQRARELAHQYLQGTISEADRAGFDEWYASMPDTAEWDEETDRESLRMLMLAGIREKIKEQTPMRFMHKKWVRYAAAAVVLSAVATTCLLVMLVNKKPVAELTRAERFKNDVAPGRRGAILSIEGGKTILLDTAGNGNVLGHFVKGDSSLSVQTETVQYATLSTPAAHTEKLLLKDGTAVYLNASSSIRFPTVFKGQERMVEITGEAYFEVKHNAAMPFKVKLPDGSIVEDIGTQFNINTYANEATINTTVAEGVVRVVTPNAERLTLNAGQQSRHSRNSKLSLNNSPDMEEILAWKNGIFRFDGARLEDMMKQVERWYGVEVVFVDRISEEFVGKIPRDVPVSELLALFEGTGHVHFVIKDKTITVYK